jgi:ribosomal protein L44E
MSLDNCKQCGRIFHKTISPLCKSCYTYEQEQNLQMYRFIQENPGITMEELAERFNMPIKEIEALVFSGVLGTANQLIRSTCSLCGCEMTLLNRVGYFCYSCNQFMESEVNAVKVADPNSKLSKTLRRRGVSTETYVQTDPQEEPVANGNGSNHEKTATREDNSKWQPQYGFKRSFRGLKR